MHAPSTSRPKQLQPKRTARNNPEKPKRLAACKNGWSVIPCARKASMPKDWPRMANDAAAIERWDRIKDSGLYRNFEGTGVRVEDELFVVDVDVKTPAASDELLAALVARWPDFFNQALRRTSGAVKVAFFGRIAPANFGFSRTHHYGEREHVELWGAGRMHYFAVSGPHAVASRVYGFLPPERAPWTVRLDSLPVFNRDDIPELLALADEILGRHLQQQPEAETAGAPGETVYDLEPGQTFIHTDGTEEELTALEARLLPSEGQRGIMTRKAWEASERKDHCNALIDRRGHLVITDFFEGVKHRWKDDKPQPPVEFTTTTIAILEDLRQRQTEAERSDAPGAAAAPLSGHRIADILCAVDPKETHDNAVAWLFANMAFCPQANKGKGGVVSLWPDGDFDRPVSLQTVLRPMLKPYCWREPGPKGGQGPLHNPVDAWLSLPDIVRVRDVQVRPDMTRPTFTEDGRRFANHYQPPQHPAEGGTVAPFLARMESLIPDQLEREWEINWLASKVQHPERRMVAPTMVARETGTGRGLLAQTLMQLFGPRMVLHMPFAKITGGEGSRFNIEMMDALIVCINEARDADERTYRGRNAARESLKEWAEPNEEIPFRVEGKGENGYHRRIAASTMIFSNNLDALPIDATDRRNAVMLNGQQMTADEVEAYRRYIADPANIGAIYRYLRDFAIEQDKAIFDPYMAPKFIGRELMIEAGANPLDLAWGEALAKLKTATELYTKTQIVALTRHFMPGASTTNDFEQICERHTRQHGFRIGVANSTNWLVSYGKGRERVYAFDEAGRRKWTQASNEAIKKQLNRAQRVVDEPSQTFNRLLGLVEKDQSEVE